MTIFQTAFEKAGFDRLRFELKTVAPQFSREDWIAIYDEAVVAQMGKNGHSSGVLGDQSSRADLSRPTPGEGHFYAVQQDQRPHADARQLMPEGQTRRAQQSHSTVADGRPIAGEANEHMPEQGHRIVASSRDPIPSEGQMDRADQGHSRFADAGNLIASGTASRRLPTQANAPLPPTREPSEADIEALKEAGDFHYFQMINLRKKAWSTYRYNQLANVRSLNMQENLIIREVIDWGRKNRVKDTDLVSLTMPASEMKEIIRQAKRAIPSKAELISKTINKKSVRHG